MDQTARKSTAKRFNYFKGVSKLKFLKMSSSSNDMYQDLLEELHQSRTNLDNSLAAHSSVGLHVFDTLKDKLNKVKEQNVVFKLQLNDAKILHEQSLSELDSMLSELFSINGLVEVLEQQVNALKEKISNDKDKIENLLVEPTESQIGVTDSKWGSSSGW